MLHRNSLEKDVVRCHRPQPIDHPTSAVMSAEKRLASNSFGTSQLVKRQKSNADLGNSKAVATTNASSANGALIQAVCSLKVAVLVLMDLC